MLIDWTIFFSLLIPALFAVVGWFLVHWLTTKRERQNKRRELRLKGLEQAYLTLANAANREWTPELELDFEKFISEIQLYGTPKQIDLTIELVKAFIRKDPEIHFDPLLQDLRDSLRAELEMEPVDGSIWWYRFHLPSWKLEKKKESNQSPEPKPVDAHEPRQL